MITPSPSCRITPTAYSTQLEKGKMGNVKELAVETDLKGSFVSTAKANINGRAVSDLFILQ